MADWYTIIHIMILITDSDRNYVPWMEGITIIHIMILITDSARDYAPWMEGITIVSLLPVQNRTRTADI